MAVCQHEILQAEIERLKTARKDIWISGFEEGQGNLDFGGAPHLTAEEAYEEWSKLDANR